MKRVTVVLAAVLAMLLVPWESVRAQMASQTSAMMFCGPTGFNVNLGGATKSFRCAVQPLTRGTGTLTLTGAATITVSPGAFQIVQFLDAIPGADDVFFRTSGIMLRLPAGSGGRHYFYRITAVASPTSMTVDDGGAAPAQSGTTTDWSIWNTTCYRSADTISVNAVANEFVDDRIWKTPEQLHRSIVGNPSTPGINVYGYLLAAGTSPAFTVNLRPSGLAVTPASQASTTIAALTAADQFAFGSVATAGFVPASYENALSPYDFQIAELSTAANAWPVYCIVGREQPDYTH